ncbi:CRISPR-associated endoribonuclease Cas6 [Peptococcaceae bacterium 1198_IL3148]
MKLRLCLTLTSQEPQILLPIHYNHYIQAAIYNNISSELARFLHERGYIYKNRSFKFFTFSRLLGKYKINNLDKTITFYPPLKLYIASPIPEFCTSIMNCILGEGKIRIYDVWVEVNNISVDKPTIESDSAILNIISPVVTYSTFNKPSGGKYTCYYQPGEKQFASQIEENLRKKYIAYYNRPAPTEKINIELLNKPHMNITTYKNTVIKGYSCKIKLYGPRELLQVAVDAGLGAKNSQGFGCVELEGRD